MIWVVMNEFELESGCRIDEFLEVFLEVAPAVVFAKKSPGRCVHEYGLPGGNGALRFRRELNLTLYNDDGTRKT